LLSPHNQDILYYGGNKLHRSLNQGDDWETISEDLTLGGKKGNVPYGTLTTIAESPFKFGLLYTGSDDGLIQRSSNGGGSWETISNGLPENLWVSRVVASRHKKERVYASLNGYRWDDFTAYIYKSENNGASWKNIASSMPAAAVNVIIEDTENENLLFAGTDNGLYLSFDQGASWELFQNGIPNVAVHDIVIQPEAKDLLVGTHGRSIYKVAIGHLQEMSEEKLAEKLVLFDIENLKHSPRWGNARSAYSKPSTPGVDAVFYLSKGGSCEARIMTLDGIELSSFSLDADKGFNILSYDVAFSKSGKMAYLKMNKATLKEAENGKTYLPKGTYEIVVSGNGAEENRTFEIK